MKHVESLPFFYMCILGGTLSVDNIKHVSFGFGCR